MWVKLLTKILSFPDPLYDGYSMDQPMTRYVGGEALTQKKQGWVVFPIKTRGSGMGLSLKRVARDGRKKFYVVHVFKNLQCLILMTGDRNDVVQEHTSSVKYVLK
ncbi:hypothetical protein NPIL_203141 [Nephila pilipes]|uniref:Uncharacterized protein n=1 Tax=Nephila pilipes TaxID=299642 RepID=A0A8X6UED4_NEPPI|nr:hypothetical protein NPIL_203141 [Nephila pilipes]